MAEHGRGIHLMGELVDSLRFDVRTEGTTVRMTKSLEFLPGAPGAPAAVSG
jgi:anti-sigma regulatory factor (Ser/Thr protein kinase)